MLSLKFVVFFCLVAGTWCMQQKFPEGFQFGAASSAYQIEGAWNVSDKCESIWDRHTHTQSHVISDGSNGDVACDSYHRWREDVKMAADLGLHFYRFSISWSRLLPTGLAGGISEDGVRYYNDVINALLEANIQPAVTIFHWELPQKLQELGGWMNPLIVDWFEDYVRVVFSLFADRVKTWFTINEPFIMCEVMYPDTKFPPPVPGLEFATYVCTKNALIAHAKVWRIYDQEYKAKYGGQVGLINQVFWFEALTPEDEELAELTRELNIGVYSHPIYSKHGGWPPIIEEHIAEISKKEGYTRSKLPAFTDEERELVRGTFDFYGINYYTSRIIRRAKPDEEVGAWPIKGVPEIGAIMDVRPEWKKGKSHWLWSNPEGIRYSAKWIKDKYGDIPIFITENGFSTAGGIEDYDRIDYYREHLEQVLLSIKEDGVNISHYTVWTLMDNFEWNDGFATKFGLYEVNFTHPLRKRTPRASAHYYVSVIKQHSLDISKREYRNEL